MAYLSSVPFEMTQYLLKHVVAVLYKLEDCITTWNRYKSYEYIYGIPPQKILPFIDMYSTNCSSHPFEKKFIRIVQGEICTMKKDEDIKEEENKVDLSLNRFSIQCALLIDSYNNVNLDVTESMKFLQLRNKYCRESIPLSAIQPWLYKIHFSRPLPDITCQLILSVKDNQNQQRKRMYLPMSSQISFFQEN